MSAAVVAALSTGGIPCFKSLRNLLHSIWLTFSLAACAGGSACSISTGAWRPARVLSRFTSKRCRLTLALSALIWACGLSGSAFSSDRLFTDKYDAQIRGSVARWWGDYPDWLEWKAQLYQESQLDPAAQSPAGAAGLAQFMPATWADVSRQLGFGQVSRHVARYAIDGGAYYMASLRRQWSSQRPAEDRQALAQASYNTGMGNMLRAQRLCGGALHWPEIAACLPAVTGGDADQTITYVERIALHRQRLSAGH